MLLTNIYKYRSLIWDSVYLLIKYSLIRFVLSDKKLLGYLSSRDSFSLENISSNKAPSSQLIIKPIKRVLDIIYPHGNCLVLCLIQRDILYKYGFYEPILLGVRKTSQGLFAHAWLSNESATNFKIVYLLP